uniref:Putative glutathione S-transferase n=1 Tax=Moniliophthora roreri TaxID=221103 RepID=A0A0W0EYB0_MONRR
MSDKKQLTLYTAKICPYAQRPLWFTPQVNPASKVPAISYGGPIVPPEQPSPDSVKLAESLILVEFVADLYPECGILPPDPVERAQARFFIEIFNTKVAPGFVGFLLRGEHFEALLKGLESLQVLLSKDGPYVLGERFSIADIAVAPFMGRMETALTNEVGAYEIGEGTKCWEAVTKDPKFEKLMKYYAALKQRPSFKVTYDEEYMRDAYKKRFSIVRAQKKAAAAAAAAAAPS